MSSNLEGFNKPSRFSLLNFKLRRGNYLSPACNIFISFLFQNQVFAPVSYLSIYQKTIHPFW